MTRRMITIKWAVYGLWTLLLLLLQQLVLPGLRLGGVHPFLLPALAAIAASFEGRHQGPVYALVLGLVCDTLFPGAFPCFYAITLTLCAAASDLAARHVIMPGPVCSLLVSSGALVLTDLLNAIAFAYRCGTPFSSSLWLMLRELVITVPAAMLVHLVFSRVHRRFSVR